MKQLLPKLTLSLFLLMCSLFYATQISAAGTAIIVSPPRIDVEGKPGETLQQTIKVTNEGDTDIVVTAKVSDFIVQDDQGTPIKINVTASGRYLASPWFILDRPEFKLAPQETVSLVAVIEIPKDALPGGHYAGVFFSPVEKAALKGTGAVIVPDVGSLFGITIAGDIKYNAIIKDFSVKSRFAEFGPVDFSATIENQSDTHIKPAASIEIHDMIGRKLDSLKLDETNIFPFTSRTLKATWQTVWGLGRYTATLSAAYGPGLLASRTLYFWIIPWRLIAAILVVLLFILAVWIVIRRHMKHREDHRDTEIDELKRKISEMENQR